MFTLPSLAIINMNTKLSSHKKNMNSFVMKRKNYSFSTQICSTGSKQTALATTMFLYNLRKTPSAFLNLLIEWKFISK